MNDPTNDWRVTAYALGQAEPGWAADVEAWARSSEEVRSQIADVAALGDALGASLGAVAGQWSAGLVPAQRSRVVRAGASARTRRRLRWPTLPRPHVQARPRDWAAAATVTAAVALVVAASPIGTSVITATYVWLDEVKGSTGYDSATRSSYDGPPVTVWDVLRGVRPHQTWPQAARDTGQVAPDTGAFAMATPGQAADLNLGRTSGAVTEVSPVEGGVSAGAPAGGTGAMVVKDAALTLQVPRLAPAMERAAAIATQHGGFVVRSNMQSTDWEYGDSHGYRQASMELRVPAARFESATAALRSLATRIVDESMSGADVTQEYIDLQSQVANLEATRARVRSFLDQAGSVDEALRVNAELARLEGEINVLKGRMDYMADRAEYSTILLELFTEPTTASPTPEAATWDPGATARDASATLGGIARALATTAIWLTIVALPLCAPFLLTAWWLRRRRSGGLTE